MRRMASVVAVLLLSSAPAWAVLGQPVDSVEKDREMLAGRVQSIPLPYYSIHQITREGGMTVKEYVTPKGMVFGVSWQGPTMPNLPNSWGTVIGTLSRRRRPGYTSAGRSAFARTTWWWNRAGACAPSMAAPTCRASFRIRSRKRWSNGRATPICPVGSQLIALALAVVAALGNACRLWWRWRRRRNSTHRLRRPSACQPRARVRLLQL